MLKISEVDCKTNFQFEAVTSSPPLLHLLADNFNIDEHMFPKTILGVEKRYDKL